MITTIYKKLMMLMLTWLVSVASFASVEIDGICYELTEWSKNAGVTAKADKYSGSITIPSTIVYNDVTYDVTYIGEKAFSNCTDLTSVTIPNSVERIEWNAFNNCYGLTSITIPNSVTSIEKDVFFCCSGLTSVILGNSVESIGDYAFFCCSNLASINIPESVTSIGNQAFYACYSLTSINIPSSLTDIGIDAFTICSGLTSISVEEGNTVYDSRDNCNAIILTDKDEMVVACKNTTFPKSVKSIAKGAFNYLDITSIKIPKTVVQMDGSPIYRCPELASIVVEEGNTMYDSRDNCNAILETSSNTLIAGCKNTVIPNTVTGIGNQAFIGCTNLESIVIPNSVTTIGNQAFSGCTKLESIVIPNSVTMINYGTFEGCTNLKSVTIGDKVTYIDTNAFGSLGNDECSALTSVTVLAKIPPTIYYYPEYGMESFSTYGTLHVLPGCKAAYEAVDGWNKFTIVEDALDPAITDNVLKDGTPYNNNSQLNGCKISYTRTFNNTSWQALYIPFSLKYEDWKDDFEIAYINGIRQSDKDDDGVIDETIMDVIKIKSGSTTPNMPYLIKAKTTGEKTLSVSNATLYPAEENSVDCSTTIAKYTFTGTYNAIPSATMIANKFYAMGGGELIQSDGSNDLKPYRWYMKVESRNSSYNASNAAKTITINVIDKEGETTSVEELQMTNYKSPVYDLNGRKVNENNLKPGIYVKNGKKFVVK